MTIRESEYYTLELLVHNTVAAKLHEMEAHETQLRIMKKWVRELIDEYNGAVFVENLLELDPHIKRLAALLDSLDSSSST